jgi:pilus assembly protein FimV
VLRAAQAKSAEPLMPDFGMDTPPPAVPAAKPAPDTNTIDFNLDPLPPIGTPLDTVNRVSSEPPSKVDFKLDLGNLELESPGEKRSAGTPGAPARDDHWYDVQQKFDLAKAYEEMGDKEGARDILQEVLKEGDSEQQAQAKKLLGSLS